MPPGPTTANNFALCEGPNQLLVRDANNCTFVLDTIIEIQQIDINFMATDVTCFGSDNGSAVANPSGGAGGPFEFEWTNVDPNPGDVNNVQNLTAQTYTLAVTDIEMCTVDTVFTIAQPPQIQITQNGLIPVTCFGDSDGAIDISVTGGTLDTDAGNEYQFDWTGPGVIDPNTEDQNNLLAGDYALTVTDDNNCTADFNAEVLSPDSITITSSSASPCGCLRRTHSIASMFQMKTTVLNLCASISHNQTNCSAIL